MDLKIVDTAGNKLTADKKIVDTSGQPLPSSNEVDKNAKGGTELMKEELYKRLDKELLDKFQIIPSRVRDLEDDKYKVLWLHDLPMDPESQHLKDGG